MSLRSALSDYGQQLSAEREALVARLCTALTGAQVRLPPLPLLRLCRSRRTCQHSTAISPFLLQAGEPQHAAAVQACLAALQHHRFADPNPREVDDAYDRQALARLQDG